ncbi:MAG: 6-phosphofructokinase [Candidatus Thiodiazotropha sp. (ex Myrtea spinifera)]|nr:6-phosphofructokinase [Candidatus Thiodiazotropha sp. (ex Myrtea spinifera)]MCU7828530.1 6-phosphofructokinase [Candidatus Thiodiazotropha sp. (ex Myrtea sp. 'scaly one' KF741663)]
MTKHIGILTAGGDSPGLNAAIRGVGKAAQGYYDMQVIGIRDGFRGLVENRTTHLDGSMLSGILTRGGTILGTSRDKPHRMLFNGKKQDMTDVIVENYHANHLDALVCLGGGGTQKNALQLLEKGLNVITLPKTIDNDVAHTDTTFGFDTALGIATNAIDRLHSTAHSHHRIIVVEIMGHRAGWLALGSGIAGGADVILVPEIPYDIEKVAEAIRGRAAGGKPFSIVAVAEGALPIGEAERFHALRERKLNASDKKERKEVKAELAMFESRHANHTVDLSRQLEELTGLESRVTILGYLQRGGTPSAADRLLATRLGTACADLIHEGRFGVMVASRGELAEPVPLVDVAGYKKLVPPDHPWVISAKRLGTNFGDM